MADTNDFGDANALTLFPAEDGSAPAVASDAPVAAATEVPRRRASKPVPPPSGSDVDALLEAVSAAGRSPMLQFHSEVEDAELLAATLQQESSVLLRWRPAIVRWVVPSAGAFLIGALSVLWGLRTLPPATATDSTAVVAQRPNVPSPVDTSGPALPTRPAPVVETPRPMPEDPPRLSVMAGVPQSTITHFTETRMTLPPVAPTIVARRPTQVLARAATPPPSVVPPAKPAPMPRTANEQDRRKPSAPVQLSAERRVEPPALTPLAKFAVRTDSLTALSPPAELPRVSVPVAPAVAPAVGRADAAAEEHAVRRTLHSYEEASEELDVAATASVWPTVDRGALTRAFATLKSQGLDFRSCSITVSDSHATANCRGTVQFVRKVGNSIPLTSEQQWIFKMRRFGADWKIDEVSASPAPAVAVQRVRGQG